MEGGGAYGARNAEIRRLFLTGQQTLQQIGDTYHVSRERVRQILSAFGITGRDIQGVRKAQADQRKREKREGQCQKRHGVSWEKLCELQEIQREMVQAGCSLYRTPLYAFRQQRQSAKERGVEWQLTLGDWWQAWEDSGFWDYRGRGQKKYVMSRFGDVGPYHEDNVFIQQAVENNSHRPQKVSGLPMGVQQVASTGRFIAMRMTNGKPRYLGTFDSVDEARHAYQTNQRTLVRKKSNLPTGVRPSGKRFGAQTRSGGKWKWLGTFDSAAAASAAYEAAKSWSDGRGQRPSQMAYM